MSYQINGVVLREIRIELELSLEAFAKKIGANKKTVKRWESCECSVLQKSKYEKLVEKLSELTNSTNQEVARRLQPIICESKIAGFKTNELVRLVRKYLTRDAFKYIAKNALDLRVRDQSGKIQGKVTDALQCEFEKGFQRRNLIFLLGEVGSGKTTCCRRYAYETARDWLTDDECLWMPLVFKLKEFDNSIDFQTWLVQNLHLHGFLIPSQTFNDLLVKHRIVLLLDGLDEVFTNLGGEHRQKTIDNALDVFVQCAKSGIPVVISCRTNFFKSYVADRYEFRSEPLQLYLQDLDSYEQTVFLKKRFCDNWEEFVELISGDNLALNEMARRPLFLTLITKLKDEIDEVLASENRKMIETPTQLFEMIWNAWVAFESKKRNIQSEMIEDFAYEKYKEGRFRAADDFSTCELFQPKVNLNQAAIVSDEYFDYEKSTAFAAFVSVDGKNSYRFGHHSCFEYAVARKMARDFNSNNGEVVSGSLLYEEIYQFLADIFWNEGSFAGLVSLLENENASSIARINCVPILRKMRLSEDQAETALRVLVSLYHNDEHPLLRYICGYTAEVISDKYSLDLLQIFDDDSTVSPDQRDANTLVAGLACRLEKDGDEWNESEALLSSTFMKNDVLELANEAGVEFAYMRVLQLDNEHEFVVRESIRILTLLWLAREDEVANQKTARVLLNYFSKFDTLPLELKGICIWSTQLLKTVGGSFGEKLEVLSKQYEADRKLRNLVRRCKQLSAEQVVRS